MVVALPVARADDPMPFPPSPDPEAIADGAKLPKLLKRVEPVLPAGTAAPTRAQRVYVAFVVDAQGRVERVSALFEPPAPFAEAAVAAVRQWLFEPGTHYFPDSRRIVPVNTQMTVLLHFPAAPAP